MNLKVKSKKINDFTYELAISAKWEDIKDDFKILYDTRMISAGKNQVFNNDLIHTVQKYKYSKSSVIST